MPLANHPCSTVFIYIAGYFGTTILDADFSSSTIRIFLACVRRGERKFDDISGQDLSTAKCFVTKRIARSVCRTVQCTVVTHFEGCIDNPITAPTECTIPAALRIRRIGIIQPFITLFTGIQMSVATIGECDHCGGCDAACRSERCRPLRSAYGFR